MAAYDFQLDKSSAQLVDYIDFPTDAGDKAINQGEIILLDATAGYVTTIADSTELDTDSNAILGISTTASTHTASADGKVTVAIPAAGNHLRLKAKAVTPANLTLARIGTAVTITCDASGVQKVNEDSTTKGVAVVNPYQASADAAFTSGDTTSGLMTVDLICDRYAA